MFSNQSVRVQPSAPPIDTAGVPDSKTVSAVFRKSAHVFGDLRARVAERRRVVPDQRLVGDLGVDAVLLALPGAQLLPARGEVLAQLGLRGRAERLEPALVGELVQHAVLGEERHVGRGAALDLRAQERGLAVAGRHEGGLRARCACRTRPAPSGTPSAPGPVHTAATSSFWPCRSGSFRPLADGGRGREPSELFGIVLLASARRRGGERERRHRERGQRYARSAAPCGCYVCVSSYACMQSPQSRGDCPMPGATAPRKGVQGRAGVIVTMP